MVRKWKLPLGLAAVLMIFSALLYQSGIENPFIFDDIAKIQDNPDLHLKNFEIKNFIHDYSEKKSHLRNDPSRPLTFFFYWLLWQAGEGSPAPFHVAGILLHALCALLIGLLTARLAKETTGTENSMAAFLASSFFLSLPVLAGTVIYAYAFSDILGAFFSLLAIWFVTFRSDLKRWQWIAAIVSYVAAVFSKQSALVLPAVLVTLDFFTGDWKKLKERWRFHGTMFFLAGIYLIWRFAFFGRLGDLEAYDTYQVSIYAPLQGIMIWKYLAWLVVPAHLAIDHALTPAMFEYWQCWLSWASIAGLSVLSLVWGRKNSLTRISSIGWILFLLGLMPTSSFFPTTDLLVDRRVYFSAAGISMAVSFALARLCDRWQQKKWLRVSLAGLLILTLGTQSYLTVQRVEIYGNEELLWREVIELFPRNERPRTNLVTYYLKKENFPMAQKELDELFALYPNYYEALTNQSALYQHPHNPKRDLVKALDFNTRALAQEPGDITASYNRGLLMLDLQRPGEAASSFQNILDLNPNLIKARLGLAESYLRLGQKPKAQDQAQKVLELEPDNLRALLILRQ